MIYEMIWKRGKLLESHLSQHWSFLKWCVQWPTWIFQPEKKNSTEFVLCGDFLSPQTKASSASPRPHTKSVLIGDHSQILCLSVCILRINNPSTLRLKRCTTDAGRQLAPTRALTVWLWQKTGPRLAAATPVLWPERCPRPVGWQACFQGLILLLLLLCWMYSSTPL